jgi:hypothetical protein
MSGLNKMQKKAKFLTKKSCRPISFANSTKTQKNKFSHHFLVFSFILVEPLLPIAYYRIPNKYRYILNYVKGFSLFAFRLLCPYPGGAAGHNQSVYATIWD